MDKELYKILRDNNKLLKEIKNILLKESTIKVKHSDISFPVKSEVEESNESVKFKSNFTKRSIIREKKKVDKIREMKKDSVNQSDN